MSVNISSECPVSIPVDVRLLPGVRRLAADYSYDFRSVAPFFSGDPRDRSAWADAIARADRRGRRAEIAAVVGAQQHRREAPPAALDAGRKLADSRTVAIVTGQQPGLFGGPLYTLLKALTALKLADRVSREHAVPAIAVFWIEAEDHDWDEVRSCTVFDGERAPRVVALPDRAGSEPAPVASIQIDDDAIGSTLADLEAALPATEFRASVMADLRRAYAPGHGMADAFGRWLERLLGDRGLVVYDSSDARAKPIVADIFVRELSTPGETSKLAALAGSELIARGYHAQVQAQDDTSALFHLDGTRRSIRHEAGQFLVGDSRYPASTLIEQASAEPTAFSPNVLLRPIVQDALFSSVCYVAGPNELAYLAQLRGVYQHFGVPMPLMYPRASATLVDSAALRFLTKYAMPFEALQPQDDGALNELLKAQIPPAVEASFAAAARAIDEQITRVAETVPAIDPTLEGAAKSTLGRMQRELETLHHKMIQAAKRRDETLRRSFTHARALAFPGGHPQERTIGFVSFLNQYGPALVERLAHELPLDLGHHWIVTI